MELSRHPVSDIAALEDRVRSLERQTRRLYVFLFSAIVLVLALGAVSATYAQQRSVNFHDANGSVTLSSEGLTFADRHGNAVLSLYLSDDQRPVIRLRDSKGRARAFFGLTDNGQTPRIEFDDTSGTQRLYVGLSSSDSGLVRSFTSSGKQQTSLEDSFLRIRDDSGNEQMVLGVSTANEPVLKMYDSTHTERLFAGIYTSGESGLTTYNSSGNSTWSSP